MPRPLVLTDHLRELPSGQPLDVGAARTPTQALTPGQIEAGRNVTVTWENGVLTISAAGTDGGGGASGIAPFDLWRLISSMAFGIPNSTWQSGGMPNANQLPPPLFESFFFNTAGPSVIRDVVPFGPVAPDFAWEA
jgi:hypothetical protein